MVGTKMKIPRKPGLGVTLKKQALEKYTVG